MQLVSRKNFMLFLAAILVVGMGYMAVNLGQKLLEKRRPTPYQQEIQQIQNQSDSDSVKAIEKDLNETDLTDIDKELQDIQNELNQTTY